MQVKALIGFVSRVGDRKFRVNQGDELPLPDGADWLDVGFVVPVREQAIETATIEPEERAVAPAPKRAARKSRATNKVMRTTNK